MPLDSRRIALQLWTLRDHLGSEAEVARTFRRVRELGYENVEVAGLSHLTPQRIRQLADDAGLGICSSHEDPRQIVEEPARVAERLAALGCRFTAYPSPHVPLTELDHVYALADQLSRAGEVLRRHGRLLTYHNHSSEFRKLAGKCVLDWLFERSDPILLHAELDTYWVQAGGGDPAGYCARLSGRLPLIHLKDYVIAPDGAPENAALGEGNLSFPIILREAEMADCQWYVVEQEGGFDDPFTAIATSYRYLRGVAGPSS